MRHVLPVAAGHDGFHNVHRVLVERIVPAAGKVRARSVVVHTKPAADIEKVYGGALPVNVREEATRL